MWPSASACPKTIAERTDEGMLKSDFKSPIDGGFVLAIARLSLLLQVLREVAGG